MARVCGLRDGDEREQSISGEASRFALLLSLAIEGILLFLTLITVSFSWNPGAPKGARGLLSVGMSFDTARHLNPLGVTGGAAHAKINWGGEILSPHAFLILALLILVQLSAFRIFASRRYTGDGE